MKPDSYAIINTNLMFSHFHVSHLLKVKAPPKSSTITPTFSSMGLCTSVHLTFCHPFHPLSSFPSYILNPFLGYFPHLLS